MKRSASDGRGVLDKPLGFNDFYFSGDAHGAGWHWMGMGFRGGDGFVMECEEVVEDTYQDWGETA